MIERIATAIVLTLMTMLATGAATILGLTLPYCISECLFKFGINYGTTQILYWVMMPAAIIGLVYLVWTIADDMAKRI